MTGARRALSLGASIIVVAAILIGISIAFILFQPSRDTPETNDGQTGGGIEQVRLPIEQVSVRVAESYPPQLFADVSGYVPDSCTKPRDPVVQRAGSTITVTIDADRQTGMMCAQVATPYKRSIPLGSVQPGTYTVVVNDKSQTVAVR